MGDILGKIWDFLNNFSLLEIFFVVIVIVVIVSIIWDRFKKTRKEVYQANIRHRQDGYNDALEDQMAAEISRAFGIVPLRNVILPWEDRQTQADMILISKKGVFAFACTSPFEPEKIDKMTADLNSSLWEYYHPQFEKIPVNNPLLHNDIHIKAINNVLAMENPLLANAVQVLNIACVSCKIDAGPNYVGQRLYVSELSRAGIAVISTAADVNNRGGLRGIDLFKADHDRLPDILTMDGVRAAAQVLSKYASNDNPERQKLARTIKKQEDKDM